jgi:hypothetical protein
MEQATYLETCRIRDAILENQTELSRCEEYNKQNITISYWVVLLTLLESGVYVSLKDFLPEEVKWIPITGIAVGTSGVLMNLTALALRTYREIPFIKDEIKFLRSESRRRLGIPG